MSQRLMRSWLYFRTGYSIYFSLPLAVFSHSVTLYYLMVESLPWLKAIFPGFGQFLVLGGLAFLPGCVTAGWIHYKKTKAYRVETEVMAESSPYVLDSRLIYTALLSLARAQGLEDKPELRGLRAKVEGMD